MDKRFEGKTCPFCKAPFQEDDVIVVCSICEMPHHLSCWRENGGCTTFGCTGTIQETVGSVRPSAGAGAAEAKQEPDAKRASRFETLFESEPNIIQGNIPVLVEKLSLILDHRKESLMARCTFRSLTERPIMALLVDVRCTDIWGKPAETVDGFQYLDLKTRRDSTFGQTKPIPIPNIATRSIEVVIRKVLYADRTMLSATDEAFTLPKQERLTTYFEVEIAEEYTRETNEKARYAPVAGETYWRCACGAINREDENACYRCHADKAQLFARLDREQLAERLAAFQEEQRQKAERERAEREEQLRQAEERIRLAEAERARKEQEEAERRLEEFLQKRARRRKIIKRVNLISAAVLLVALLVYLTGWHLIPYIRYTNACDALAEQSFDEAYSTFVDLADYRDSAEKATDTLYQKGIYLKNAGAYLEAAAEFDKVANYRDSAAQANSCRSEAAYLSAKALLDASNYREAANAFTALAGYSDSAELATLSKYQYAQELLEQGAYADAFTLFDSLENYQDSENLATEAKYLYAIACFDAGDYENAVAAFRYVGTEYKDVAERLSEAQYRYAFALREQADWKNSSDLFRNLRDYRDSEMLYRETYYQYGLELLREKSYVHAISVFNSLKDYGESAAKVNEAKYGYVQEHMDRTDHTTYGYLKDLKAIDYLDSTEIYASLYAWKITNIVINDSESDTTTNKSSVSKYNKVYCHFKLAGGPPDDGVILSANAHCPGGNSLWYVWDFETYAGEWSWYCVYHNTPAYASAGTLHFYIYDYETGTLLGDASTWWS